MSFASSLRLLCLLLILYLGLCLHLGLWLPHDTHECPRLARSLHRHRLLQALSRLLLRGLPICPRLGRRLAPRPSRLSLDRWRLALALRLVLRVLVFLILRLLV